MRTHERLIPGAMIAVGLAAGSAIGEDATTEAAATPEASTPALRIAPGDDSPGLWCFRPSRREAQAAYERGLGDAVDPASLRAFHDRLAGEPHPAGTDGDRRIIEFMRSEFERMGLEVEVQWIEVYLARPVSGKVEIVRRDGETVSVALPVMERPVEGDESCADPRLDIGWNAYSASGEATGEVVYANYGTKEDFERLRDLGVDCAGKIVIARYGRNFRGYKAKFAEESGAAGLIIYNDPENVGYVRGLMYPEGGWANETQIQRGSIKTLAYVGDPLTPGEPAVEGTRRLDPQEVALPRIPVQPAGWVAAEPILAAMRGPVVPEDWQGGLGLNYRLEGGEGLRVRVKVEQTRELVRTANVVGMLRGEKFPEQTIVVGCHHDAWTHGAGDPTAGLIVVMEMARNFAEMAARSQRPARTIRFAGWAAEEYGIVGSTEWIEQHAEDLSRNCVAYLNLDMAAMGPRFGASAAPLLKSVIVDAARDVEQIGRPGVSVHEAWDGRDEGRTIEQQIGSLGGGSDHVGFYCHLGIPSMSMGAGGSSGVSYHSAYDTLEWYRKVVGEDYAPAAMVTKVAQIAVGRLANADVIPFDPMGYPTDIRSHLERIRSAADELGFDSRTLDALPLADLEATATRYRDEARRTLEAGQHIDQWMDVLNRSLIQLERIWIGDGLPNRPWFRNRFVATDENSGYAAWMLPDFWYAIAHRDDAAYEHAAATLFALLNTRVNQSVAELERTLSATRTGLHPD